MGVNNRCSPPSPSIEGSLLTTVAAVTVNRWGWRGERPKCNLKLATAMAYSRPRHKRQKSGYAAVTATARCNPRMRLVDARRLLGVRFLAAGDEYPASDRRENVTRMHREFADGFRGKPMRDWN